MPVIAGEVGHFMPFNLASKLLLPKVRSTIDNEPEGMSIAATSGDKFPCTANNKPMIL